jgi:hypothetical protein
MAIKKLGICVDTFKHDSSRTGSHSSRAGRVCTQRTPRLKRNTSRNVISVTMATKIVALISAPNVFVDVESVSCAGSVLETDVHATT